jgi:hypothetical protein
VPGKEVGAQRPAQARGHDTAKKPLPVNTVTVSNIGAPQDIAKILPQYEDDISARPLQ